MKKYLTNNKIMKMMALVMVVVMALLAIPTYNVKAEDVTTYEVGDYKGDKDAAEWTAPTQDGKVFAGWYTDDTYTTPYTGTTGEAYAKFVDADVLVAKKQLKTGTTSASETTDIRFITSINSLKLECAGFDVKVACDPARNFELKETVAYTSILVDGQEQPETPADVFGTEESNYFVLHSITGIPKAVFGDTITVTPYWVTLDGTKVTGKGQSFTVIEELLAGSLFTDKVSVNGTTVTSGLDNWDISQVQNNIVTGTNSTNSFGIAPIYFKETGDTMLLKTTITDISEVKTGAAIGESMAGLYVTDGSAKGKMGLCGSGLVFGQWSEWHSDRLTYSVLGAWGNAKVDLVIAYKNSTFYIYVDGVYFTSITHVQALTGNASANTNLAFGLTMARQNGKSGTGTMTFSNTEFTTDADIVNKFLAPQSLKDETLFTDEVTVNDVTLNSGLKNWDITFAANNIVTGTHTTTSAFYMDPIYFNKTGSSMLLQTKITNISETIKSEPMAGLYVTDGTNKGYFGLSGSGIVYGQWAHNWSSDRLSYAVLSQWGNKSVQLDIALKDGAFYIYADGNYITSLAVSSVMFTGSYSGDLAFGLTMRTQSNEFATSMQFSNIQFTTDATAVDAFLAEKAQ